MRFWAHSEVVGRLFYMNLDILLQYSGRQKQTNKFKECVIQTHPVYYGDQVSTGNALRPLIMALGYSCR